MSRVSVLCLALLAGCGQQSAPLEILGTVPGFRLNSHKNVAFDSLPELKGRVWVANFIFTNCTGPCPRMSSQMRQVQDASQDLPGLRMVSITVDPARDTPEVLAAYAKRQHAGDRWIFLTGELADLHHLKRNVMMLGNVDGQLNHSTRFVLVDRASRIRGYYDTSEADSIARILKDIRRLEKEA